MKVEDPFTRRSTRPTMVTKTKEPEVVSSEMLIRLEHERKIKQEEEKKKKVMYLSSLFLSCCWLEGKKGIC